MGCFVLLQDMFFQCIVFSSLVFNVENDYVPIKLKSSCWGISAKRQTDDFTEPGRS